MFDLQAIKGIIFDYGGTIDSNGMHWAEVIWKAYEAFQLPIAKDDFRNAYVFGERTLGKNPLVLPHHTFQDMLRLKINLQIDWLTTGAYLPPSHATNSLKEDIADWCYDYARKSVEAARPILEALHRHYPMVLVSNFYGNIESVLKDFNLQAYFDSIIESAIVGVRKPDPAIFALGIEKLKLPAKEIVVVGDSYDKDILPAASLGCQTIWLKSIGWSEYTGTETADRIICDFGELKGAFGLQAGLVQ